MNPRVTLGLLAVLLALGGYIYFGGAPPSPEAAGKPTIPGQPPARRARRSRPTLSSTSSSSTSGRPGG